VNSNTQILKNTKRNILDIIRRLKNGEIVALPTETVYGLAGRCDMDSTIKNIYKIKNRPRNNPLIIHYGNAISALKDIHADSRAKKLAKMFWPGPLTIVAKVKNESISKLALSNLDTIAVRVPSNKAILSILKNLKIPIAAPSANRYGKISPTSANDVYEELNGKVSIILDGGISNIGLESTIVDLTTKEIKILRPGAISKKIISEIVPIKKNILTQKKISSPGLSLSHYSPDTSMRINAIRPKKNEAWLAYGEIPNNFDGIKLSLSKKKCLKECARNLYKMLRKLDKKGVSKIAVQKIPEEGLGIAINDRLKRAAYKKLCK